MRKASNICLNVNRVRFTFDGHLFNLEVKEWNCLKKAKRIKEEAGTNTVRTGRKAVCVQAGHIWMGSRNVEAIDREPAEPEPVI